MENFDGLTSNEAKARLKKYEPNDVAEKKLGIAGKFLAPLYSPISLMLLAAAVLSYFNKKIFDVYFIIALYAVNYLIQKWQEFKADRAIEELRKKLSFDISVLRDGNWIFIASKNLVPGDRIRLGLGSVIPADAKILSSKNLSVNEAVLTGESMPKEKKAEDMIYSGSFITSGNVNAIITATGKNTSFGKTIFSVERSKQKSILEKDILSISRFLTIISLAAVLLMTLVFALRGNQLGDILTLDLSLVIAGIPIALPVVMTIILSIGALSLAKKSVIVRRLSALQDLSNVNLLLTDKTGTLTKNEISVVDALSYDKNFSKDDVVEFAGYAALNETPDAIDSAIIKKNQGIGRAGAKIQIISFIPYDPDRKRSTAFIERKGEKMLVSMGAPQVIQAFDDFASQDLKIKFERDIKKAASEGFRVLAVALKKNDSEEKNMNVIGLLYLADPLDESSGETIKFMEENGIAVKILTGDNRVITQRIANELKVQGTVLVANDIRNYFGDTVAFKEKFGGASAFAEILPKDKYEIVKTFKSSYVVAATGDGINDLPSLKVSNVGIAVLNAVSALKSMADIVLLGKGISVIKDAILESRKIFVRLYNYSVYRISESFRLIITILLLGLWYGSYPLQPIQIILLAFLNDIPIISLATDRVKTPNRPSKIETKKRFVLSLLFGCAGIMNSIFLFLLMTDFFHMPLPVTQTMFFLKLTVSGHLLIYVAHTKERWFKFLPSKQVIIATFATQIIATFLAVSGWLMPSKISFLAALFVWIWSFFWMQITELMKDLQVKLTF